jgi:hypothetical protein
MRVSSCTSSLSFTQNMHICNNTYFRDYLRTAVNWVHPGSRWESRYQFLIRDSKVKLTDAEFFSFFSFRFLFFRLIHNRYLQTWIGTWHMSADSTYWFLLYILCPIHVSWFKFSCRSNYFWVDDTNTLPVRL